jgi:hypothetical protein
LLVRFRWRVDWGEGGECGQTRGMPR